MAAEYRYGCAKVVTASIKSPSMSYSISGLCNIWLWLFQSIRRSCVPLICLWIVLDQLFFLPPST
ncbi:Uncharacterised protein [Vibrio cholerae]|nr:Uncharacterised protein [Vibrio cholerae]CSI69408.1 Uncharacterised protein [Vibrio cholerae]